MLGGLAIAVGALAGCSSSSTELLAAATDGGPES